VQGVGAQERGQRYAFLFGASQNRDPEPQESQQRIRREPLQTARPALAQPLPGLAALGSRMRRGGARGWRADTDTALKHLFVGSRAAVL